MNGENEVLVWAKNQLEDDRRIKSVLMTAANALAVVQDMDIRMDIYDACAERIRNIIQEKAGVDIAEYL